MIECCMPRDVACIEMLHNSRDLMPLGIHATRGGMSRVMHVLTDGMHRDVTCLEISHISRDGMLRELQASRGCMPREVACLDRWHNGSRRRGGRILSLNEGRIASLTAVINQIRINERTQSTNRATLQQQTERPIKLIRTNRGSIEQSHFIYELGNYSSKHVRRLQF